MEERPERIRRRYFWAADQRKQFRKLKADWNKYYRDLRRLRERDVKAIRRREKLLAGLPEARKRGEAARRWGGVTVSEVKERTKEAREEEWQEAKKLTRDLERFRIEQRKDSLEKELALTRHLYEEELVGVKVYSEKFVAIRKLMRAELAAIEERYREKELRSREAAEEKTGRDMAEAARMQADRRKKLLDRQKKLAEAQVDRQEEIADIQKRMREGGPRVGVGRMGAADIGQRIQDVLLKRPEYQKRMLEELKKANKKHDETIEAIKAERKQPGLLA